MSGTDTTNNGWPVIAAASTVRLYIGQDVDGCTFRAGDVAQAFAWLFEQIHARVEPVTMLNGWRSTQDNAAAGGDPGSNHMSGTAGDVNGYRHPYEAHTKPWSSGWTTAQQQTIRGILNEAGGLFSWGMDYAPGWRDAMHFDITKGRTDSDVTSFVRSLKGADMDAMQAQQLRETHDAVGRLEALWGAQDGRNRVGRFDETADASKATNEAVGRIEPLVTAGLPIDTQAIADAIVAVLGDGFTVTVTVTPKEEEQ